MLRERDLEHGLVKFVQKLATICKLLQTVVGGTGLEPVTSAMSTQRSNH